MEMFFVKIAIVLFLAVLLLIENVTKNWNKRKSQSKKQKQNFAYGNHARLFPWPRR